MIRGMIALYLVCEYPALGPAWMGAIVLLSSVITDYVAPGWNRED